MARKLTKSEQEQRKRIDLWHMPLEDLVKHYQANKRQWQELEQATTPRQEAFREDKYK